MGGRQTNIPGPDWCPSLGQCSRLEGFDSPRCLAFGLFLFGILVGNGMRSPIELALPCIPSSAVCACPSRSCWPSDEWCMGSRMRRPSPRPPPSPSPTPPPPAPFPTPSSLLCSCVCGCACRQPVCEMRMRPNGPLRMASALAACVSALFQPTSTRWYVCCRVGMTFEFSGLTEL